MLINLKSKHHETQVLSKLYATITFPIGVEEIASGLLGCLGLVCRLRLGMDLNIGACVTIGHLIFIILCKLYVYILCFRYTLIKCDFIFVIVYAYFLHNQQQKKH